MFDYAYSIDKFVLLNKRLGLKDVKIKNHNNN